MSKFICLDVIEVGPVYFNPDYIVQFYFDGRNTVVVASLPIFDGRTEVEVSNSVDDILDQINKG